MWTDFNEIEKLAFESQPLPKYHAQSEQIAYLSMRCVYHDYRLGYLDKEQAQKERGQIKSAYLEQSEKKSCCYPEEDNLTICGLLWVRLIKILNYMDVNYVKKWFVLWMGGYLWMKTRRNNAAAESVIQLSFILMKCYMFVPIAVTPWDM